MWKVTMYREVDPYVGREKYEEYFDTEDEALDYMYIMEQLCDCVMIEEV